MALIYLAIGMVLVLVYENIGMKNEQRNRTNNVSDKSNTIKNPDDWKTGDEEMTGAQRSYLNTLSEEAGEEIKDDLTKAEAAKKIDELQQKTGRGIDH